MTIKHLSLSLLASLLIFTAVSCNKDTEETTPLTNEQNIQIALNEFVAMLIANPPTDADISGRVKAYLQAHPTYFFGSTVAMLDSAGLATYSPYWYRSGDSLLLSDLAADTSYHINDQYWLRQPIDSGIAIWTPPYFDAGGGNINMKTRSVPVVINGNIIAVATTDLSLE